MFRLVYNIFIPTIMLLHSCIIHRHYDEVDKLRYETMYKIREEKRKSSFAAIIEKQIVFSRNWFWSFINRQVQNDKSIERSCKHLCNIYNSWLNDWKVTDVRYEHLWGFFLIPSADLDGKSGITNLCDVTSLLKQKKSRGMNHHFFLSPFTDFL